MEVASFAELLLIMTSMNFYVTIFGPSLAMALYRHLGEMGTELRAVYTGALFKIMLIGLVIIAILHLPLYGVLTHYWNLSLKEMDYLYALVYMICLSLDTFLLSRAHFDYHFRLGFISRFVYFVGTLLIIPFFLVWHNNWMLAFIIAPLMSVSFLSVSLVRSGMMRLRSHVPWRDVSRFGREAMMFILTGIISQFLMYSDRWILAAYNVPKPELAYYIIAVQAGLLVSFPVDRMSELMMPYIGHLSDMNSLTKKQATKSLLSLALGLIYMATFGLVIGYLFFKLYHPDFMANGWRYFLIILAGTCFFSIYTFSRAYVFRFFSAPFLYGPFLIGTIVQIGGMVVFLSIERDAVGAAYGRFLGFLTIGIIYMAACQTKIVEIALSRTEA